MCEPITEQAVLYTRILDEIIAQYPVYSAQLDMGPSVARAFVHVPVRITPEYERWLLSNKNQDICDVQCDDANVCVPGRESVQHLLLLSVHIVKQMLAKGVEPHVAIGLLPSEIASRVHYIYWNTHT